MLNLVVLFQKHLNWDSFDFSAFCVLQKTNKRNNDIIWVIKWILIVPYFCLAWRFICLCLFVCAIVFVSRAQWLFSHILLPHFPRFLPHLCLGMSADGSFIVFIHMATLWGPVTRQQQVLLQLPWRRFFNDVVAAPVLLSSLWMVDPFKKSGHLPQTLPTQNTLVTAS